VWWPELVKKWQRRELGSCCGFSRWMVTAQLGFLLGWRKKKGMREGEKGVGSERL